MTDSRLCRRNVVRCFAPLVAIALLGAQAPPSAAQGANGDWSTITALGYHYAHTTIYDPVHDRLIVFGGLTSSGYETRQWTIDLATNAWSQLDPTGTAPPANFGAAAIYDPVRDRMIVCSSFGSSTQLQVWTLDLSSSPPHWEHPATVGADPPALIDHAAVYDPVRDRLVVVGGRDAITIVDDNRVWALPLSGPLVWSQLVPGGAAFPARNQHSAIYDPAGDRIVVFGGYSGGGAGTFNDVWSLSLSGGSAWSTLTVAGTPPPPSADHAAVLDAPGNRMIVYGGHLPNWTSGEYNTVWSLSLDPTPTWTTVAATTPPIWGRCGHTASYDPARGRAIVYGGYSAGSYSNELWSLSLTGSPGWSRIQDTGAPPVVRRDASAIYDPVRDREIVFGGYSSTIGELSDVWSLGLNGTLEWTHEPPAGTPPPARSDHVAVYDPVGDRMVVFGGGNTFYARGDVWALGLTPSSSWTQLLPAGPTPQARWGASAIYDPEQQAMIVFGGGGGTFYSPLRFQDVWMLSLAGPPAWTEIVAPNPPEARYRHTAILDPVRRRMIVYGGQATTLSGDLYALSLDGVPAWTTLAATGTPPSPRSGHTAIHDAAHDRMVVFGGGDNQTWALDLGTLQWTQLAPAGTLPGPRSAHTAVYDPDQGRMIVFAGSDGSTFLNDVQILTWGSTVGVGPIGSPVRLRLAPPSPNPTRSQSVFSWSGPGGRAVLRIVDITGRTVATLVDGAFPAGPHQTTWDLRGTSGAQVAAGIYVVEARVGAERATRRFAVLR
jgi:hypothetical protein